MKGDELLIVNGELLMVNWKSLLTSLQKDQFHHKGTKFTKNSLEEHKEKLCTL